MGLWDAHKETIPLCFLKDHCGFRKIERFKLCVNCEFKNQVKLDHRYFRQLELVV